MTAMEIIRDGEPHPEDCNHRHRITVLIDGTPHVGWACWYPQMGGYCSKALAVAGGDCVDVYVWHDGDFPFTHDRESPRVIHHCCGDQFVSFGQFLNAIPSSEDA